MRSYGQFCGVAKALDVIGDRWSLLIVRELMILGPCRYTDLQRGLPGIATNLLADRLRSLDEAGVVRREVAPPPVATTLVHLTERGEGLVAVIRELGRWGAPLLADPDSDDAFRSYWITLPLELFYHDPSPDHPPVRVEVRMGDEPMTIETVEGNVRARRGSTVNPDAVMSGPPHLIIGVLSGRMCVNEACAGGLEVTGVVEAIGRIRPRPAPIADGALGSGLPAS